MSTEPRATYRIQLHSGFTLDDARTLLDYYDALGISHLYCSPYLQAARGSLHGYDVVDPQRVNVELGGEEARKRLVAALKAHDMGQMLDVVPNHMAIGGDNPWWWDVLKYGPASRYATYFDVEWNPPEARHKDEVLIPVLGDQYGRVLEAGEIQLDVTGQEFLVRYYDNAYPVDPRSQGAYLHEAAQRCASPRLKKLAQAYVGTVEGAERPGRKAARQRAETITALDQRFCTLRAEEPPVDEAIQSLAHELNSDPDRMDAFLQEQNYRLAHWRITIGELGYRRFFDINTLIGLRMEDEEVFQETHRLVLRWLRSGDLDGLRIDHPDGLLDPEGYFRRIQEAAPDTWVVIEKILEGDEQLPATWPVSGTTGYEFLNRLNGLFVDPRSETFLVDLYERLTGRTDSYSTLVRQKKLQVMSDLLGSDLNRLVELFVQVCERQRNFRDYTRRDLRAVLMETAACLPVYRTYVRAAECQVSADDARYLQQALDAAAQNRPEIDPRLFAFFGDLMLLRITGELESELVLRFQQFTGPVMAKGVEDTVFYNYYPLVSLNEVGGDPGHYGVTVEAFHQANEQALLLQPRGLLSTTTHDTKRSEDVRARISVLSEMPDAWGEAVERWFKINRRTRTKFHIDPNDEYLLYQTLAGAWPIEEDRVLRYMEKAVRESKTNTSWTNPDAAYENAVAGFVRGVMKSRTFRRELQAFVVRIEPAGWVNSLAQTLIKLTAPGVPDIYQGAELWVFTLVDPDNRAPVDYEKRKALLAELEGLTPEEIWERAPEGLPKLWVVRQALSLRRRHPAWFEQGGGYTPLHLERSDNLVAFQRGDAICVVPRLAARAGALRGVRLELPAGRWNNELTGELLNGGEISAVDLFRRFPVALLARLED